MNDKYCICKNPWIKVFNTTLHSNCYYCPSCDKIYQPTVKEVTRDELAKIYTSNRFDEIKRYALIKQAKKKVTPADLLRLGYYRE